VVGAFLQAMITKHDPVSLASQLEDAEINLRSLLPRPSHADFVSFLRTHVRYSFTNLFSSFCKLTAC
jgi:chorismate synthase